MDALRVTVWTRVQMNYLCPMGAKKRSIPSVDEEKQTAETLSAIIRVLAEGETEDEPDNFYKNTTGFVNHNISPQSTEMDMSMMVCMADSWFVSMVISMSSVGLMLSALTVVWGCQSLQNSKMPM